MLLNDSDFSFDFRYVFSGSGGINDDGRQQVFDLIKLNIHEDNSRAKPRPAVEIDNALH